MKAIKLLIKAVVAIVALVVVALLLLPIWFGPVVKTAANIAVPKVVKTDFRLGHLSLNPYTARFELGDLQLWNPQGYSEKYAATVGDITFDAETLSLMTDVIHIEEIKIKDIFVSYVSGGENKVNNFTQIQYNVAGGKEKFEQAQAKKQADAVAEAEKIRLEEMQNPKAAEAEKAKLAAKEKAAKDKPAKKLIIDRLEISGLVVQLGFIPLHVPSFTLTDIGRKSGGATLEEAWQQIWAGILKAAGAAGDQLKALGNLTGDAAKQATKALGNATEDATKALGNATEGATKAASQATEAVSGAAGKAAGAVGDAAGKATEAAGKALDSLKSLW